MPDALTSVSAPAVYFTGDYNNAPSARGKIFKNLISSFLSAVLAVACISLRTRFLIALTAIHAIVAAVSLFYFVAVRKLNKPTPEKPNAKNGFDENHIN